MSIANGFVELLAPVGNVKCLKAAINSGADAIYLGMPRFNARENAENFDETEFAQAIDLAHRYGVKVYLTVNTLVQNNELDAFMQAVDRAYISGVDAFIVQDLGVANLLKKYYPDIDLHASTQMSICDVEGALIAKKLGFKRIVLARELNIEEIAKIHKAVGDEVELEVFVHGALCVSCSGQCLISSMIGGRSGNRGKCAQTCRMRFDLLCDGQKVDSGYLLSTKDICAVELIKDLVFAGVTSFKIEGRMRQPEYVATVVSIYKKYLDKVKNGQKSEVSTEDIEKLMQMFNRGGKHAGWLTPTKMQAISCSRKPKNWGVRLGTVEKSDNTNANLVCIKLEKDLCNGDGIEIMTPANVQPGGVVSYIKKGRDLVKKAKVGDTVLVGDIKGNYKVGDVVYKTSSKQLNRDALLINQPKKENITMYLTLRVGEKAQLKVVSEFGNVSMALSENDVELAKGAGISIDRIKQQLEKVGDYAFEIKKIKIDADENTNIYISASSINSLRRDALDNLVAMKESVSEKRSTKYVKGEINYEYSGYQEYMSLPYSDEEIYRIPCNEKAGEFLDNVIDSKIKEGIKCIEINNLAHIKYIDMYKNVQFVASQGMNIFNDFAIEELEKLGVSAVIPSMELYWNNCELDLKNANVKIYKPLDRVPIVMTTKYCSVGKLKKCPENCAICPFKKHKWELLDKKGAKFEINLHPIRCGTEIKGFKEVQYE